MIIIYRSFQAFSQQGEIYTSIPLCYYFPINCAKDGIYAVTGNQVSIACTGASKYAGIVVACMYNGVTGAGVNIVVTQLTPRSAEFHQVEHFLASHKVFIRNNPTYTY